MPRPALVLALVACVLLALPAAASGQAKPRVKNGADAETGQFPWTVALVYAGTVPDADEDFFCGGTLIRDDLVVTAAHCTAGMGPQDMHVFAGNHDRGSALPDQFFEIESVHLIPTVGGVDPVDDEYVPRRDVSVLKLATPGVVGAETVPPVLTTETGLWLPGTALEVAGWGRDVFDDYPLILQHAVVQRWEDGDHPTPTEQDCEDGNFDPELGFSVFEAADMLCALGSTSQGDVVDSCNGDSGGPLTTEHANDTDPEDRRLVGIVSFGSRDCDEPKEPGVYTRVGAADINTFINEYLDGDPGNDDPEQLYATAGPPSIEGSAHPGETLTCTGSGEEAFGGGEVSGAELRIFRYDGVYGWRPWVGRGYDLDADPEQQRLRYTIEERDLGTRFDCQLYAFKAGAGGYALALSPQVTGTVRWPQTEPEPEPEPEPVPPAPIPLPPALPDPPVVAPRDTGLPSTSRITRRCGRRGRCTITIRTTDTGLPTTGVTSVAVRLATTYRCRRGGRSRQCTRRRTLSATSLAPGVFRVRTGRLPLRSRNVLRVRATDAAGNREARSRVFGFRLRRAR